MFRFNHIMQCTALAAAVLLAGPALAADTPIPGPAPSDEESFKELQPRLHERNALGAKAVACGVDSAEVIDKLAMTRQVAIFHATFTAGRLDEFMLGSFKAHLANARAKAEASSGFCEQALAAYRAKSVNYWKHLTAD